MTCPSGLSPLLDIDGSRVRSRVQHGDTVFIVDTPENNDQVALLDFGPSVIEGRLTMDVAWSFTSSPLALVRMNDEQCQCGQYVDKRCTLHDLLAVRDSDKVHFL